MYILGRSGESLGRRKGRFWMIVLGFWVFMYGYSKMRVEIVLSLVG